jgi:hypothetical protein
MDVFVFRRVVRDSHCTGFSPRRLCRSNMGHAAAHRYCVTLTSTATRDACSSSNRSICQSLPHASSASHVVLDVYAVCACVSGREGYLRRAREYAAATKTIVAALTSMPGIQVRTVQQRQQSLASPVHFIVLPCLLYGGGTLMVCRCVCSRPDLGHSGCGHHRLHQHHLRHILPHRSRARSRRVRFASTLPPATASSLPLMTSQLAV